MHATRYEFFSEVGTPAGRSSSAVRPSDGFSSNEATVGILAPENINASANRYATGIQR